MTSSSSPMLSMTGTLTMQFLEASHGQAMQNLQTAVYDALPAQNKHFILPKSETFFKTHFERARNWAIGAFMDGQLVGQCLIVNPCDDYPETGMVDMEPLTCPKAHISILQGLLVLPHYRGHKIGARLIETWIDTCIATDKTHLMSETACDNRYSWSLFLNAGVPIVSCGRDPDDNTAVFNHLKIV